MCAFTSILLVTDTESDTDSREVKPKIVFGFRILKPVSLVRS